MKVEAGRNLLHYRLVEKIGEGGMGVVWKAIDTALDREVAIKVLPDVFSRDPERLSRFEREARLLATLNHPNIAAVYGLHEAEGQRFIAMELVLGEDLSQRLSRGPLSIEDALATARRVAEALEAAHEKGVIHRDLKPANVKLAAGGEVKVLDFGLAKALAPTAEGASVSNPMLSPTVTSAGTIAGVVLGTAAYMSPEQARGRPVDRRTDIWSYGCLLYELLAGRQAFGGDTISDSLAALLARTPDWSALPGNLPPAVRQLLARCLDKDARTRLRDIGEARVALAPAAPDPAADSRAVPDRQQAAASRWPERIVWLALIAAVAAALAWRSGQFGKGAASGETLPSFTLKRLTELPGPELQPSLSPDGRQLLYTSAAGGNRDVYLLRVGGDRAIDLTASSPLDDHQAAFSPDGERIAFRSERDGGGLFVMGATGESVRRLTDFGFDPAWSPDGQHLAFATEAVDDPYLRRTTSGLWTVALDTGQTTRLTEEADGVQPTWSPTGGRIAYWSNTDGQRDIWTRAASGGERVPVTRDRYTDWSPAWSPDARTLYFSSDRGGSMNLWRVAIDVATGAVSGDPRPVTAGTRGIGYARLSADGTRMVVMAYDRTADVSLYAIDALLAGDERPQAVLRRQSVGWCSPAPDGVWLACTTKGAQEDLVTLRADGSELRRLTDDVHKDRGPIWTPDGESLIFYSARGGKWDYWWMRTDGSGLRPITTDIGASAGGALSPDGSRLALNASNRDLIVVDVGKPSTMETATRLLSKDEGGRFWRVGGASWSPDGSRLVVVETDDAGTAHSYALYDFESGALRALDVAPGGGARPVAGWLPDPARLVLNGAEGIVLYDVATGDRRRLTAAVNAALSRDGRVLMIERDVLDSEIWLLTFE